MNNFKYLGTVVVVFGRMDVDIILRVSGAWENWKKCSGVVRDRKMPVKSREGYTESREMPATKKSQERRLEVNEMRMLRWMYGVTKKDKIRNDPVGGSIKVAPLTKRKC